MAVEAATSAADDDCGTVDGREGRQERYSGMERTTGDGRYRRYRGERYNR